MNTQTRIDIKPKNATPKGFLKFIYYLMIVLGFLGFMFGGFIIFFIGIWAVFINPKKIENNYPISYTLTDNELIAYGRGGQVKWRILWEDIESLYLCSHHWAMPKSLGIRLNNWSNFQASLNQSQPNNIIEKFVKSTYHPTLMRFGRLIQKSDIIIHFMFIDRSADDLADLLSLYMQHSCYQD